MHRITLQDKRILYSVKHVGSPWHSVSGKVVLETARDLIPNLLKEPEAVLVGAVLGRHALMRMIVHATVQAYANTAASPDIVHRTLVSPDAQSYGIFGYSVAASRKTVVVGAPGKSVDGFDQPGHAYIF